MWKEDTPERGALLTTNKTKQKNQFKSINQIEKSIPIQNWNRGLTIQDVVFLLAKEWNCSNELNI